jgi:porin
MGILRHTTTAVLSAVLAISSISFSQTTEFSSTGQVKPDVVATLEAAPQRLLNETNEHGVSFQGTLIYDWTKVLANDGDSGNGSGRYSIDLFMPVDGKKLLGLSGTTGFVRLKNHVQQFGETYDGAAQLFSNIDADSRTTLYELWIQQTLFSDRLQLKGGKIDANTEFATVQTAGDFLNSSMGYSPTIVAFPSYPQPKLGINAFVRPRATYSVGMGAFQTAGLGTLLIVEPGHTWKVGQSEQPGRASLGYWRLDGKMARFDGSQVSGTQGFYSVVEQSLMRRPLGQGERTVATFLQFGAAEGQVSQFTRHVGGGAVLQGVSAKRSHDGIGVAATWVRFSAEPAARFNHRGELAWEAYYKAAISKHLAFVQDFQYLHHPGGLRAHSDCPVITPRMVISF